MEKVYETFWRNKFLTVEAKTIDEMISRLEWAVAELRKMKVAGVTLDGSAQDDYARLITTDLAVAEMFDMESFEYDTDEENDEDEDDEEDE